MQESLDSSDLSVPIKEASRCRLFYLHQGHRQNKCTRGETLRLWTLERIFFSGLGIRSFDLLIFSIFKKDRPWSNRSRWSIKKIQCDQIALVDLLKRSTVIESLSLIFEKIKKIEKLSKTSDSNVFDSFPPLVCQKIKSLQSICALRSFDHKKLLIPNPTLGFLYWKIES